MKILSMLKEKLLIVIFVAISNSSFPQNDYQSEVLLQVPAKSKLRNNKSSIDNIDVLINFTPKKGGFPEIYIIKAKVFGKNSTLSFQVPDSLLNKSASFKITKAVYLASTSHELPVPEVFGEFGYLPFPFYFKTVPDSATIYLIPLTDWEELFKTSHVSTVMVNDLRLDSLADYKISKQRTPLEFSVFEQPYIVIFNLDKQIKKELIRPKRKVPQDNKVEVAFNQ